MVLFFLSIISLHVTYSNPTGAFSIVHGRDVGRWLLLWVEK